MKCTKRTMLTNMVKYNQFVDKFVQISIFFIHEYESKERRQ